MNFARVKTYTEQLLVQRRWLTVAVVGLFSLSLLQGAGLIYLGNSAHQARIVERPLGLNTVFWVSNEEASPSYLAGLARYLVQLYLDVDPATVTEQHQLLLQSVAPQNYDAVKRILLTMQNQIKTNDETCEFLMETPQVDTKMLVVKIRGTLIVSVGNAHTIKTDKLFLLKFEWMNGRLLLTQFS